MKSNWTIEVIFINKYADSFDKNEQKECKDSEFRFQLAIIKIIDETGVIPMIGDWIEPLAKDDYSLDIARIAGRDFYAAQNKIRFELE